MHKSINECRYKIVLFSVSTSRQSASCEKDRQKINTESVKRITGHCSADLAGGDDLPVLNANAVVFSRNKVCVADRAEGSAVRSGHSQPPAHRNLAGECHIPVGKDWIHPVLIRLIEENLDSIKCDLLCGRTLSVLRHVLRVSPTESSHDVRTLPAGQHRTTQPPRGMQCVPVQESVRRALPHRHHPAPEPPSAG